MTDRLHHFLGASGALTPGQNVGKIYPAENEWTKTSRGAGQSISEQGANDLMGEIVHSKYADEVPGIEHIRATYSHTQIHHLSVGDMPLGPSGTPLHGAVSPSGEHVLFSPRGLQVGKVTHEASHLLNSRRAEMEHGWAFARTHAFVAHHAIGKEQAAHLGELYQKHGVQYKP